MPVAQRTLIAMQRSSWIRKMFETGLVLKKQYGEDRVFDFSLGNPDVASPPAFDAALIAEASKSGVYRHGYMQNQGYLETRQAVADHLQSTVGLPFTPDQVIMTCGAAGAINVILKAILNPGEEVIVIAPFFTEYDFYIENHQGKMVIAQTTPELLPDLDDIAAKITSKTRAIIINSPNNPTGEKFVNYWLHCEHLLVNGEKMSKSLGNFIYPRQLVNQGYEPAAIRYTLLTTHYRQKLNFTFDKLEAATKVIVRLRDFYSSLNGEVSSPDNRLNQIMTQTSQEFESALDDDLNISEAMAAIFTCMHEINNFRKANPLTTTEAYAIRSLWERFDTILNVLKTPEKTLTTEEQALIEQRTAARKVKNWAEADRIRQILAEKGVVLEDTPQGTVWKKR